MTDEKDRDVYDFGAKTIIDMLAGKANEAAERFKALAATDTPHVPERVDTAKPCACGKPAVHFAGTGRGLDSTGKPFDEPTGGFCSECFNLALGEWGNPEALLPKEVTVSTDPHVAAVDRLTNAVAQGFRALVLALGKIERRTT